MVPLIDMALHYGWEGVCLTTEGDFWHSGRALDIRCRGCRIIAQAALARVDPVLQETVLHIDMETGEQCLMPLGLAVQKDLDAFMRAQCSDEFDASS